MILRFIAGEDIKCGDVLAIHDAVLDKSNGLEVFRCRPEMTGVATAPVDFRAGDLICFEILGISSSLLYQVLHDRT